MKTKLDEKSLRQHLTYSWWKYLLIVAVGILAVDILYTMTARQIPADKKIELFVYGYADDTFLNTYMEKIHLEQMPEMEMMSATTMLTDDMYGPVQLVTYVAAREGDLYLVPRDEFLTMSAQGAFIPLEEIEPLMAVMAGSDLQRGWRRNSDTGENHLYGIPLDKLPGLVPYVLIDNGYLCVLTGNGNEENVFRFMTILCRDMLAAPAAEEKPAVQ